MDATDFVDVNHCVKAVRIRSYSGPYSVRMRENTDTFHAVNKYVLRSFKDCKSCRSADCFHISFLIWVQ